MINHIKKILEYLTDLDFAENAILPFVLGQKNWLLSNTERWAEASAFYYSMIATAKLNGINVHD